MIGRGNAQRHRDRALHAHHAGDGLIGKGLIRHALDIGRVRLARDRAQQERGAGKPVCRLVGAGQEGKAADLLPVGVQGKLFLIGGRVRHHDEVLAVVHHKLAADVLEDSGIARGIRDRQMQGSGGTIWQGRGQNGERFRRQPCHRLGHGGIIVQHVLRPGGDAQQLCIRRGRAVLRLGQIQQVGDKALFVHSVRCAGFIARDDHAAVKRRPGHRPRACSPVACHTGRKHPDVRGHVLFPVHVAARDDHAVIADKQGPRAGQRRGGQRRAEDCRCRNNRNCLAEVV